MWESGWRRGAEDKILQNDMRRVCLVCAHQLLGEENSAEEHALIHYCLSSVRGVPTPITLAVRVSARVNGSREEFEGNKEDALSSSFQLIHLLGSREIRSVFLCLHSSLLLFYLCPGTVLFILYFLTQRHSDLKLRKKIEICREQHFSCVLCQVLIITETFEGLLKMLNSKYTHFWLIILIVQVVWAEFFMRVPSSPVENNNDINQR